MARYLEERRNALALVSGPCSCRCVHRLCAGSRAKCEPHGCRTAQHGHSRGGVRPDCTSGPLPSIQLTSPPENGKVTVKKAQVTATNYKQCLALEVPGFVAFYRSRADFAGVDVLTLEVKFPDGKTQVQRISVTVGAGSPGRRT
jgi:hypothetical protein